jgi:uncharacterized iron-regulated membrane protein
VTFRSVLLVTHRWVGVGSAAIVVLLGATGALLVWPSRLVPRETVQVMHDSLALGRPGWAVVVLATAAAVYLQVSGLFLWWRRRSLRVQTGLGWRRLAFDLHHAIGALFLLIMLATAASGLGRIALRQIPPTAVGPAARRAVTALHTTTGYSAPVKGLFFFGSLGLVVQGVTGVLMWWPRTRRTRVLWPE